jgi:hypothetical protein
MIKTFFKYGLDVRSTMLDVRKGPLSIGGFSASVRRFNDSFG